MRAFIVFSVDDDAKEYHCGSPNTEDEIVSNIGVLVHMNECRSFIARCNDEPDKVLCKVEYADAFVEAFLEKNN